MNTNVGGSQRDEHLTHALHLRPRSHDDQRRWYVGTALPSPEADGCLRLHVRADCHESFASLRAILRQLRPLARHSLAATLVSLEALLNQVCPERETVAPIQSTPLVNDPVSFAMTRRVSRESVYTARIIDRCAQLLNGIVAACGAGEVHVPDVDRLDRPTVKVLARAMLLLQRDDRVRWVWHVGSGAPLDGPTVPGWSCDRLFACSRNRLFRQLLAILQPTVLVSHAAEPSMLPAVPGEQRAISEITEALVLQNYDACLLWLGGALQSDSPRKIAEGLRVLALVAANIGELDCALDALARAETLVDTHTARAHLCYLQGLLEAKRRYDLSASTAHYLRGVRALDTSGEADRAVALERAWLLNGLALNDCLLWRRGRTPDLRSAFDKVREAFQLVSAGNEMERVYLRFNLVANSAFLLEMEHRFVEAVHVLTAAFDTDGVQNIETEHRLKSTLLYRTGVMRHRAGELDAACRDLEEAADRDAALECRPTQERILRALGVVLLDRSPSRAQGIFSRGLALCREARFSEGTVEHARGLAHAYLRTDRGRAAEDLCTTIEQEEGIDIRLCSAGQTQPVIPRPAPPSPKLPAYIPEIDLEDIPAVDLNRHLVDLVPRASQSGRC